MDKDAFVLGLPDRALNFKLIIKAVTHTHTHDSVYKPLRCIYFVCVKSVINFPVAVKCQLLF